MLPTSLNVDELGRKEKRGEVIEVDWTVLAAQLCLASSLRERNNAAKCVVSSVCLNGPCVCCHRPTRPHRDTRVSKCSGHFGDGLEVAQEKRTVLGSL